MPNLTTDWTFRSNGIWHHCCSYISRLLCCGYFPYDREGGDTWQIDAIFSYFALALQIGKSLLIQNFLLFLLDDSRAGGLSGLGISRVGLIPRGGELRLGYVYLCWAIDSQA